MFEAAGDLARETGIFGLIYAPATVVTFATTDYDELMRSPWFVVAKVIFINVMLPTAFAVWRVIRQQRKDTADATALAARVARQDQTIARLNTLIGELPLTIEQRVLHRAIMFEAKNETNERQNTDEG
jgi:uncharacterized coiled-coil protein SlyX